MSKKPYARPQYKVKPAVIIIVAVIVFIFAALIVIIQPTDQERIYNAYNAAGSPNIQKDNVFESISTDKLIRVIETGVPVVVYFGTPSCTACVSEIGWYDIEFESAGLKQEVEVIYYLKADGMSDANKAKLQDKLGMALAATPEVYYFNDGEIVTKRADAKYSDQADTMQLQIKKFFQDIKTSLAD